MKKVLYFAMAMFLCLGLTGCFNTPTTPVETEPEQTEVVEDYEIDSTQLEDDEIVDDTIVNLEDAVEEVAE